MREGEQTEQTEQVSGNMKVLQWQKGCDTRVKDERRQGEVNEGRARRNTREEKLERKGRGDVSRTRQSGEEREMGRRRTETIIALSYHCTVINVFLVREPVPKLGPGLMTNHFHTALRSWLFMIRQLGKASWALYSSWVGVVTLGSTVTTSNEAALLSPVCPYCAFNSDRHLRTSSSCYWGTLSVLIDSPPLRAASWPPVTGRYELQCVRGQHRPSPHFSKLLQETIMQINQKRFNAILKHLQCNAI